MDNATKIRCHSYLATPIIKRKIKLPVAAGTFSTEDKASGCGTSKYCYAKKKD